MQAGGSAVGPQTEEEEQAQMRRYAPKKGIEIPQEYSCQS